MNDKVIREKITHSEEFKKLSSLFLNESVITIVLNSEIQDYEARKFPTNSFLDKLEGNDTKNHFIQSKYIWGKAKYRKPSIDSSAIITITSEIKTITQDIKIDLVNFHVASEIEINRELYYLPDSELYNFIIDNNHTKIYFFFSKSIKVDYGYEANKWCFEKYKEMYSTFLKIEEKVKEYRNTLDSNETSNSGDKVAQLSNLKGLLDTGAITKDEFNKLKKEIIG